MADYNTLQRRRNVIVGAFVIIAACALIWMISIFGNLPVAAQKWRSFEIVVHFPSAPGVQQKTPIQYCGSQIGKVIGISAPQLGKDEEGIAHPFVSVGLAIEDEFTDIPANVDIRVIRRSIGSSYIELFASPDQPVTEFLRNGMELFGSVSTANEFIPEDVQDKLELFVDRLTSLTSNLDVILGDEENQENIKQSLSHIAEMTKQATATLKTVQEFSENGSNTLESVRRLTDTGTETLEAVQRFSDTGAEKLRETAENLSDSLVELHNVLAKVNNGSGTIGKLLNDGLLYENLLDSSQQLQEALEQLKNLAAEMRENGVKIKL